MSIPTFEEVMKLTRTISGSAALEDAEAKGLYDCCLAVPKGGDVVEIGCQLGRSSSLILQMSKAIGFDATFVDPYRENPEYLPQWISMMHGIGHRFTFHCGTVDTFYMPDPFLADLVFVDGDHSYEAVKADLHWCRTRLSTGGVIAAHDYANDGLPGVRQAINEFMNPQEWEHLGTSGSLGMWRSL